MEDIPQPASHPYSEKDVVCVIVGPDDPDAQFHGQRVEVIEVLTDDLDVTTDRELDRYTYRVRRVDTGEIIPVEFRHGDLVPSGETS